MAGHLQGLSEGDILALLPTAASGMDRVLGYMKVTYSDTFNADLEPVAHNGLAEPDLDGSPKGSFARKLEDSVDYSLTVALPDSEGPMPGALADAMAVLKEDNEGTRIRFVPSGSEVADIRLAVVPDSPRPDAIWMLPGSGYFEPEKADQTPSVGIGDRTGPEIAALMQDNLEKMSRAINLLRMGGQYDNYDLGVDLRLQTKSRTQRQLTDLDTSSVPILVPNDQVHVLLENSEEFPVDVNVLHIGSDYAISHFFHGRLQPGDTLKKGLFRISDDVFGRDRVVIILSPADPQSATEDLRFLAQDAVAVTRGKAGVREEDSEDGGFSQALKEAGFGATTRGAVSLDDDSGPAPVILQFDIDTVPG